MTGNTRTPTRTPARTKPAEVGTLTTLKTRRPTGAIPWPFVLVEGGHKSGRTWICAELSADDRVGRFLWYDLGEGSSDEYGANKGWDYEVVEHDGTWACLMRTVDEATEVAQAARDAGEKPIVLFIDNGTAIWDLLSAIARQRASGSRANRIKLQQEGPSAEIQITSNYWNDVHDMHDALMAKLKVFPGIVLMVADGRAVARFENGQPVAGKTDYKVDADRKLEGGVTCWVRLARDEKPIVVGCRSVHYGVRPGVDAPRKLPSNWTMAELIFDTLKCDPKTAHVRNLINADPTVIQPEAIAREALDPATTPDRMRELHRLTTGHGYGTLLFPNERRADEMLLPMIERIGKERAAAAKRAAEQAAAPQAPAVDPEAAPAAAAAAPAAVAPVADLPAAQSAKDPTTAQGWADLAHKACTVDELAAIRPRIPDELAGKTVTAPGTSNTGTLAEYVNWLTGVLVKAHVETARAA